MELIPMLILGGLALLAWTFIEPLLKTKLPVTSVVPVPKPVEMITGTVTGTIASNAIVSYKPISTAPPRWQKFDNLLQMRDDLVAAGHPEDEVAKTCAELAAKLLGVKK